MSLVEWIVDKHTRVLKVIPHAHPDPWTMHGSESLCIGCLPTFVNGYMADVPKIMTVEEAKALIAAGILSEEFE